MKKQTLAMLGCVAFSAMMSAQTASFDYFSYSGNDARFNVAIDHSNQYFNPILAGYYPDPSVCRVGDTYYLVNSSFAFFPGVPLHKSKDLVNWTYAGAILNRESQLPLGKQWVSGGIYAPTIRYNKRNKTFYMITTNVGKGNFFVKTKDPEKGWSEPVYLPKVEGIDPSFMFDDDGKAYIVHNAPVVGEKDYEEQTAIRLLEFDVKGDSVKGGFKEILRGGTSVNKNPRYIEGPHLYHIGSYYYLMCAEGGTEMGHSEVILRSKKPEGPWEEYPGNPILTQRSGLDPNRPAPVTSAGHADLVDDGKGNWWAVFLGCRPYEGDSYNTGRDTYLLPVTWKDGWPVILEPNTPVPTVVSKSGLKPDGINELAGNFKYTDDFSSPNLHNRWMFLRNPTNFWQLTDGRLDITPQPGSVHVSDPVSALMVRQQHECFTATTSLLFNPASPADLAGLTLFQNEGFNFVLGKTLRDNKPVVVLTRTEKERADIASARLNGNEELRLRRLRPVADSTTSIMPRAMPTGSCLQRVSTR